MKKLQPKYNWKDRERLFSKAEEFDNTFKYVSKECCLLAIKKIELNGSCSLLGPERMAYFELFLLNNALTPSPFDSFGRGYDWNDEQIHYEPEVYGHTEGKSAMNGNPGTTIPGKEEI